MTRGDRHDTGTPDRSGAQLRVVVADDDRFFREVLVATLEADCRFSVVGEAGDGPEAVALARELTPDLVVLDLTMPVMDGIEVARELRGTHPQIGILMCSGDRRHRAEAMLAGVDRWVDKPADRRTLLGALLEVHHAGDPGVAR